VIEQGLQQTLEETLIRSVAAVLHICNLKFDGDEDQSTVRPDSSSAVDSAEKCLQVDPGALISSLTNRQGIRDELWPVGKKQAKIQRDALATLVYAETFGWVKQKVSDCIGKQVPSGEQDGQPFVALLDLFGFENFAPKSENSFEQ
jgi:myosin heavy subunit